MPKVLIPDEVSRAAVDRLEEAGLEVDYRRGLSGEALREAVGEAEGLIVRSATRVTEELLQVAPRLRAIVRAGMGVDNVDLRATTRRGIVVMNTPGGNTVAAAEHTLALLMALSRNIPQAHAALQAGRWDRKAFMGRELHGKRLGLVGVGRIGQEVARRAVALGMEVWGYDPFIGREAAAQAGVRLTEFDELLTGVDIISLHLPYTPETRHFLGREELNRCRRGVLVVNCARGGVVDEEALLEALETGQVSGAALDVFEREPPEGSPLLNHPRVIMTPHLGASTLEAQESVALQAAEQMVAFFTHGLIRNPVNTVPLDRDVLEAVGPYLTLAERLGSLAGQLLEEQLVRVTVTYHGEEVSDHADLLSAAVLGGLLANFLEEPINLVNARHLAKERAVGLEEVRTSGDQSYVNLIDVQVIGEEEEWRVAGTLFGRLQPRIVALGNYLLEAIPEGEMLLCSNTDRPGVIGMLGSLLGEAGINIANMSLGRDQTGGQAVAILNLDSPVPPELMQQIADHEEILWVKQVRLPPLVPSNQLSFFASN